jgi:hypothetical protein
VGLTYSSNAFRILFVRTLVKLSLRRPRSRWKDIPKVSYEGGRLLELAKGRMQWWISVGD